MAKIEIRSVASPALGTISYVVFEKDGSEAIIIDAGHAVTKEIESIANESGLKISTLANTHGHFDHIADNNSLSKLFGLKIAASKKDAIFFADPEGALGFPLPIRVEPSKIDIGLDSTSVLRAGSLLFSIIETPGHTPGSICLYEKSAGVIFSGDTLFAGTCGRTDLRFSSEEQMRESLHNLAKLPAETLVYPGHGKATSIGAERKWMGSF